MLQASLLERDGGCCQPAEVYKESAKCNDGDKLNIQFVCIQSAFVYLISVALSPYQTHLAVDGTRCEVSFVDQGLSLAFYLYWF